MEDPWQYCKLVEEDPKNGQLVLLKDNVVKLQKYFSTDALMQSTPIACISILGSRSSGKSIYTNLIAEYLNKSGRGWTRSIKEKGPQGFQFGCNGHGTFAPDEDKSAIYFWPQLFRRDHGNGPKLIWILHVNHKKMENELEQSSLNLLLGIVSSAVVDIAWKGEKTCMTVLTETATQPIKNQLCLHVVHLIRKIPNEPVSERSSFPQVEKAFVVSNSEALSGDKEKIQLGMSQCQQLEKLFNMVIDETELHPRKLDCNDVTMSNFEHFLVSCINLVNLHSDRSNASLGAGKIEKSQQLDGMPPNVEPDISIKSETLKESKPKDHEKEMRKFNTSNPEVKLEKSKVDQVEASVENPEEAPKPQHSVQPPQPKERTGLVRTKKWEEGNSAPQIPKEPIPICRTKDGEQSGDKHNEIELNQFSPEVHLNWPLIGQRLHQSLSDWIDSNLKRGNIEDIENVFETCTTDIITSHLTNFHSNKNFSKDNASQFTQLARNEISAKFKEYFLMVQQGITNFSSRIDVQFEQTPYFPPPDLRHNIKSTINKILAGTERQNIGELIEKGCNKIIPYYEALNERRIQFEKSISTECSHQLRNFYRDEMNRILETEKYYHPDTLEGIHNSLVNHLKKVYIDSMNTVGDLSPEMENLRRHLYNNYEEISKKNKTNIEAVHKSVNSLISQVKSEYEVEMDTYLQDHPKGVKSKRFDEKNEKTQNDLVAQFRRQMIARVKTGEGIEQHVNTLKMYMEKSHGFFEEENQENLKDSEKNSHEPLVIQPIHSPVVIVTPKPNLKELPPLLIHLALNKIGYGALNNGQIENEIYTTAEIAVTNDNKWIYGDEVRNKLHSGSGPHTKVWHLSQCFAQQSNNGTGNYVWTEDFMYLGKSHKITAEFVLAMLLATIKSKIEDDNEGRITTALISIPFWFPSYQRQQVIDATKMAGFDTTHLLNENSSCAYFMYSSDMHEPQYDTVIISESSHRVDISLYSYDKGRNKLIMLGHSGDYEASTIDSKGWYTYLPGYSVLSYLFSVGNKKGEEDLAVNRLTNLWKLASNRTEKIHYSVMSKRRKVVISCESDSWVDILTKVAKKAGIAENDVTIHHKAAIHGMAGLYKALDSNFNTTRNIIRDGMPYYLNVYPPVGERQVALKKDDTFTTVSKKKHTCKLRAEYGSVLICQENSSGKLPIGQLIINKKPVGFTSLEISLTRSHEGVIELDDLKWSKQTFSNIVTRQNSEVAEFKWKPFNLSKNGVENLRKLCVEIQANLGASGRIAGVKQAVKDKATYILAAVNGGKGNFKNGIVRSLTLKLVNDTLAFAEQLEVTENELKQKIEFLDNIVSNYML